MGLGRGVGDQRARIAAQNAANSPLLETSIQGARRLLINITAGSDFSIGEAHEAMEYILQFADPDEADIIMGHVLKESEAGDVQITILAAGMEPNKIRPTQPEDVFFTQQIAARETTPSQAVVQQADPIQLDEIDLDIPTFLRRQKLGGS